MYERSIALIIHRGLKPSSLLEIVEHPNVLSFPETQTDVKALKSNIKYLGNVNMPLSGTIAYEKIEYSREVMKQIIGGAVVSEELKWNK